MSDKGYICHGCAYRRKAEWPEGHRGSAHEGKCAYCAQIRMLTSITDWRWPANGETAAQAEKDK